MPSLQFVESGAEAGGQGTLHRLETLQRIRYEFSATTGMPRIHNEGQTTQPRGTREHCLEMVCRAKGNQGEIISMNDERHSSRRG
ncbi:hypothetical protein ACFL53_00385 [Pseudomonadota bacterium]